MNCKSTPLIILLFSFISFSAIAQDEIFKVLASKGSNKVSAGNANGNITIGKKLYKTDKITVASGGYLGLVHNCGKTIEIKKAGTYEVGRLSSEVAAQNKGVCKKYVDYVVGEMTAQDEDMAKNKYKYMAVTGSVDRGGKVAVLARSQDFALNDKIVLRWLKTRNPKDSFIVKISDLFGEILETDTVSQAQYVIDLKKLNLKEEKSLKWEVSPLRQSIDYTSEEGTINSLTPEKESTINKEITEAKSELNEENAINKFVLANIYAQHNLYIDAVNYYSEAIQLAPDVEHYKIAFEKFLLTKELATKTELDNRK